MPEFPVRNILRVTGTGATLTDDPTNRRLVIDVPGASGGGGSVATLSDVTLTNLVDDQVLRWDASTSRWRNETVTFGGGGGPGISGYTVTNYTTDKVLDQDNLTLNKLGDVTATLIAELMVTGAGGGGGATTVDGLTDAVITTPQVGQVLKYNGVNWVNDVDSVATVESGMTQELSDARYVKLLEHTANAHVSLGLAPLEHVHDAAAITTGTLGAARIGTHTHSGDQITSGTLPVARVGTGTRDATTFLRGDGSWAVPPQQSLNLSREIAFTLSGAPVVGVIPFKWMVPFNCQITYVKATMGTPLGTPSVAMRLNLQRATAANPGSPSVLYTTNSNRPVFNTGDHAVTATLPNTVALAAGDLLQAVVDQIGTTPQQGANLVVQVGYVPTS